MADGPPPVQTIREARAHLEALEVHGADMIALLVVARAAVERLALIGSPAAWAAGARDLAEAERLLARVPESLAPLRAALAYLEQQAAQWRELVAAAEAHRVQAETLGDRARAAAWRARAETFRARVAQLEGTD